MHRIAHQTSSDAWQSHRPLGNLQQFKAVTAGEAQAEGVGRMTLNKGARQGTGSMQGRKIAGKNGVNNGKTVKR